MKKETVKAIERLIATYPFMGAVDVPNDDEILSASARLNAVFHDGYREFLSRFGGAIVGPYPIYGLRPVDAMDHNRWSVVTITESVRESIPETKDWVVISEDHAGNPIGFDPTGLIWTYDHDFGGAKIIARDFDAYLEESCLPG